MKKKDLKFRINYLPDKPGVYMFKDHQGIFLYVGKAMNLKNRVASYLTKGVDLGSRTKVMLSKTTSINFIVVENEFEALLLEANLIKKHIPRYNVRWMDGKAYPFIKITTQDKYPKVLEARRVDDSKALFFGPYPTVREMRTVLRLVRRIFPFQSFRNHPKRPCLYYHLGLCPCPTVYDSKELKKAYRRNIRHLIQFLEGKKKNVIKELLQKMGELSQKEKFEEAAATKKQIEQIELITNPFQQPTEYLQNPNLLSDQRQTELNNLKTILKRKGVKVRHLTRIECYDISNIQGRNATGSMVVFINGEKESSLYRHFKIRIGERPNDVLMMKEVLERRLKHQEWEYPGLIVIDGGKGQVSGVLSVLNEKSINIPVIGLAKRLEEIVILKPRNQGLTLTQGYSLVRLPLNSPALNLLRRIRDEAHRFAISYHRKLRSKLLLV